MPELPDFEVISNARERYIEAKVKIPPMFTMSDNAAGPAGWSVVLNYDTGDLQPSKLLPPTVEDIKKAGLGYLLPPSLVAETTTTLGVEVELSQLQDLEVALVAAAEQKFHEIHS